MNRSVNYADLWGGSNSYSLSEVKGETSSTYDLKVTVAVNFTIGATVDYIAEMLGPGVYRIHRSNLPWGSLASDSNTTIKNATMENVVINNVVCNGQMRGAMVVVADMTVSKNDLSISSMTMSTQGYLNGQFELKNYPRQQTTYEGDYYGGSASLLNRTINNYNVQVSSNITNDLALSFVPALDLYHFPINGGESWNVASTATIDGNISGTLNVVGLPADLQSRFFTNNPYNLTGFPINLANINSPNSNMIQNGKISTSRSVAMEMKAMGPRTIYDPTLGVISVYYVQSNSTSSTSGSDKITLWAEKGRIVGIGTPGMKPTAVQKATDGVKLITQEVGARPQISLKAYTSRYVTGVTAAVPTWNVGDKWALTGTKDLNGMLNALGDDKTSLLSALTSSAYTNSDSVRHKTMNSADLWGKISSSAVIEVVGKTTTDYQLRVRMGAEVAGGLYYSYNADIIDPGTYRTYRYSDASWGFLNSDIYENTSEAISTNKDVSYQGSVDGATYIDATVTVSRANLSIASIKMTSSSYLTADIMAKNVPKTNSSYDQKNEYSPGDNWTVNGSEYWTPGTYHYGYANLITVKSTNYNYTVDFRDNLNLTILFSDYLPLMKFPMAIGDAWSEPTSVDVKGNISGHMDVTGLSPEANSSLMKALDRMNVKSLPIDLARMYDPNTTKLDNGTISFQTVIEPSFKCTKAYLVDDAVAGKVVALQIVPTSRMGIPNSGYMESMFSFDYLPDSGRISSVNVNYIFNLGMKTTTTSQAEASLTSISKAVSQGFATMTPIVLSSDSVLNLQQNQALKVSVDGIEQTLELISTNGTASVFRMGGVGGQLISLNIGESRQLDLNGDGKNDVSLLLSSVTGASADFSVTKLGSISGTNGSSANDMMIFALVGVVGIAAVVGAVLLVRRKHRV